MCAPPLGVALGVALALAGACAASPPPPAASLDQAFAAIQVHEARIEHARATVSDPSRECAAVCAAGRDATGSAAEACAIAREAADADALTRCELATRSATSLEAQAVERCTCGERAP